MELCKLCILTVRLTHTGCGHGMSTGVRTLCVHGLADKNCGVGCGGSVVEWCGVGVWWGCGGVRGGEGVWVVVVWWAGVEWSVVGVGVWWEWNNETRLGCVP